MSKKHTDVRRFIFTGAPGSGKTSVIKELENLGYSAFAKGFGLTLAIIHEAATDLIRLEKANGTQEPWPWEGNNFINKIAQIQKERQLYASGDLQFYDRSPFCTYALSKYLANSKNIEFIPSDILLSEIDRCLQNSIYQNRVLFFENLGFVECTDVRKINYQEALFFEQLHLDTYRQFGFEIVLVPKETIEKRCEFLLKMVKL